LIAVWCESDEASIFDRTEVSATTDKRIGAADTEVLANPAANKEICDFAEARTLPSRDSSALFIDDTPDFGAVAGFMTVVEVTSDLELAADTNLLDVTGNEVTPKLDLPIGREEIGIELSILAVKEDVPNGAEDRSVVRRNSPAVFMDDPPDAVTVTGFITVVGSVVRNRE